MTSGVKTIIYPVMDLAQAKARFVSLLGEEPTMDEPYYVGFRAAGQDTGLDPHGHSRGMTGPVSYWHVDDLQGSLKLILDAGGAVQQPVATWAGASSSRRQPAPTATR